MSVEKVKNMLPFTVAEEKSPTLQTLLGLCLQETTLISLLIWYSTFYRVLPVNSFYRWFLPVNRWSGRFAKFTSLPDACQRRPDDVAQLLEDLRTTLVVLEHFHDSHFCSPKMILNVPMSAKVCCQTEGLLLKVA